MATPSLTPPNVPEGPAPYLEVTSPDGTGRPDPPLTFLLAYDYRVLEFTESGLSGTARIQGTRFADPYGGSELEFVNLEIPNDPWPPTFELTMRWTCVPPRPPAAPGPRDRSTSLTSTRAPSTADLARKAREFEGPGRMRYHSPGPQRALSVGAWRSLVARIVRDDEVGGSNPLAPTNAP